MTTTTAIASEAATKQEIVEDMLDCLRGWTFTVGRGGGGYREGRILDVEVIPVRDRPNEGLWGLSVRIIPQAAASEIPAEVLAGGIEAFEAILNDPDSAEATKIAARQSLDRLHAPVVDLSELEGLLIWVVTESDDLHVAFCDGEGTAYCDGLPAARYRLQSAVDISHLGIPYNLTDEAWERQCSMTAGRASAFVGRYEPGGVFEADVYLGEAGVSPEDVVARIELRYPDGRLWGFREIDLAPTDSPQLLEQGVQLAGHHADEPSLRCDSEVDLRMSFCLMRRPGSRT